MSNVPEHLRQCDEETSDQIADRIILSLAERVVGYLWTREQWGGDVPFDITIDHILARANGGSDEVENLQTLCRPCNSRKGARQ